jgi:hypothetical protein
MVAAQRATAHEAVDCLSQVPRALAPKDRAVLVGFLRGTLGSSELRSGETLEPALRELLYLVLSTPEYQLG